MFLGQQRKPLSLGTKTVKRNKESQSLILMRDVVIFTNETDISYTKNTKNSTLNSRKIFFLQIQLLDIMTNS